MATVYSSFFGWRQPQNRHGHKAAVPKLSSSLGRALSLCRGKADGDLPLSAPVSLGVREPVGASTGLPVCPKTLKEGCDPLPGCSCKTESGSQSF